MPGQSESGVTLVKIRRKKKTQVLNIILDKSKYRLDTAKERIRTRK